MTTVNSRTISVLVANRFGVLARVAGLFSGRGYNIISLTVNPTHDPKFSQMTIVTSGDEAIIEQIEKQLQKLVDVVKVQTLSGGNFIEREMALFKIKAGNAAEQGQIIQLVEVFQGKVIYVAPGRMTVEISGDSDKIDNFTSMVREFGILEMARSGRVAISKKKSAEI
ncbi:MAG: acetolactate synthase small subunit [Victivallaceae bacterium]|nr:acetolactate synthase small subunit [Victivallaceae bacterium]